MMDILERQHSLFSQEVLQAKEISPTPAIKLALMLDHRQWLRMLADDWWPLQNGPASLHLGVGLPLEMSIPTDRATIIAWIDPVHLPNIPVQVYRQSTWLEINLSELRANDEEIIWPGAIPLFSIASFSTASDDYKTRLQALSKQFGDLAQVEQPITVKSYARRPIAPSPPLIPCLLAPPADWDRLRGAAAMAVWAVPAIKPWLDVLCQSFSLQPDQTIANTLGAPWWNEPPWMKPVQTDNPPTPTMELTPQLALWRAMLNTFAQIDIQQGWQRTRLLDHILQEVEKGGIGRRHYAQLEAETRAILADQGTIDAKRGDHDPVGLILQLLLLRPKPGDFVTWKDDLPAMPPIVWWSGAMLSGYLTGYSRLETRFLGSVHCRRLLALRTWQFNSDFPVWPDSPETAPTWHSHGNTQQLQWNGRIWAERTESNRSKWLTADLRQEHIRKEAILLASRLHPASLHNILRIRNKSLPFSGNGTIMSNLAEQNLAIEGEVVFQLPEDVVIESDLDEIEFQKWLLQGGIAEKLVAPPLSRQLICAQEGSKFGPEVAEAIAIKTPVIKPQICKIPGLLIATNFLSKEEEQTLLYNIEQAPWLPDLKRRVQHYGWKYEYKSRKIDAAAHLGPLPPWAMQLAERLFAAQLVKELPDQVIVNEYVGDQCIAAHIDCPDCFRGAIVTISLLESWEMIFKHKPTATKIGQVLERNSAVILDGEARNQWTHEITKRKNEAWGARGRRVSVTFRKVNVDA